MINLEKAIYKPECSRGELPKLGRTIQWDKLRVEAFRSLECQEDAMKEIEIVMAELSSPLFYPDRRNETLRSQLMEYHKLLMQMRELHLNIITTAQLGERAASCRLQVGGVPTL